MFPWAGLRDDAANKRGAPELRLVGYRAATTGKFYEFLTHNFSLSAKTIAALYKDRWQVELFFKAIKQKLNINAFVGRSKNAILTQIWVAMITYLLVAFARYYARYYAARHGTMRVLVGRYNGC